MGLQQTKPNVVTNTVGLAAEKSDKQVDLQQNGEAGAVCQATSSQSIADGDVLVHFLASRCRLKGKQS